MKSKLYLWISVCLISLLMVAALVGCDNSSTTTTSTATTSVATTSAPAGTSAAATTSAPASTTTTSAAAPTTTSAAPLEKVTLNISAAASLTDAITAINQRYMELNQNVTLTPNFASSGTLQTQIEQGAPVDVFLSAAAKQMNALQNKELIDNSTRQDLLNNKVVLIVPVDSSLEMDSFAELTSDQVTRLAIGDPEFVPAGTYAKQAFDLLGIYEQLQPKLLLGSDVRQVLAYVESGNVDAGITYSTDTVITDKVKIIASAPDEINAKIVYPVAIIKASTQKEAAQQYIDFLFTDEAKALFEKYGFSMVGQ